MARSKMIVMLTLVSLVALAAAGCSSDNNPATPRTPVDTTPPAVPANLSLAYDGEDAVLSWDENTVDIDLAGYVIVRDVDGTAEILVDSPTMLTSFVDSMPPEGRCTYSVAAVDEVGNESAAAQARLAVNHIQGDSLFQQ